MQHDANGNSNPADAESRRTLAALKARYGAPLLPVAKAARPPMTSQRASAILTSPRVQRIIRQARADETLAPVTKAQSRDAEQVIRALGQLAERQRVRKALAPVSDDLILTGAMWYAKMAPPERRNIDRALAKTTAASRERLKVALVRAQAQAGA